MHTHTVIHRALSTHMSIAYDNSASTISNANVYSRTERKGELWYICTCRAREKKAASKRCYCSSITAFCGLYWSFRVFIIIIIVNRTKRILLLLSVEQIYTVRLTLHVHMVFVQFSSVWFGSFLICVRHNRNRFNLTHTHIPLANNNSKFRSVSTSIKAIYFDAERIFVIEIHHFNIFLPFDSTHCVLYMYVFLICWLYLVVM